METISIINGDEQFLTSLSSKELNNIDFQCEQESGSDNEAHLGYILVNKMETDFKSLIVLLLKVKSYEKSIVWVFSERKLSQEEETILMKLEANIILSAQSDIEVLAFSIKNFLSWVDTTQVNDETTGTIKNTSDEKIFLDIRSRSLMIYDEEIELTNTEYLLFAKLLDGNDSVVTYESLSEEIDGPEDEDARLRVSNIIFHIRKKLKKNKFVEIKNIRSRGYRLVINYF